MDVHRDSVTACCRHLGPKGGVVREKNRFTTTTAGLAVLADWLGERQIELVAMEATGVYWKPVVRHEAPCDRAEMKGLRLRAVAAAR